MPSKFGGNILDFSAQQPPTALNFHLTPSAAFSFSEFQATSHASQLHYGSYTSDLARGKYNLSWDSLDDMVLWLKNEQKSKFIELLLKETPVNPKGSKKWTKKHVYVCAWQGSGGRKEYEKKHPEQTRKILPKRCGCSCRLVVKSYPNTERVLGHYEESHTHPIGKDNAHYVRLPMETRLRIAEMLRLGITHKRIVRF